MIDSEFRQAVCDCLQAIGEALDPHKTMTHVARSKIDKLLLEQEKDIASKKDHEHG